MNSRMRLIGTLFALVIAALALALPGIASAKDRNHDRIPDRWEKKHNLSLKVKQTKRDQDRDGLRNRGEFRAGTDPHDGDSDNDGTEDGDEGAGTIASFDTETGKLTINAFDSSDPIVGKVTEDTRIRCDGGDDQGDEDGDGHGGPGHDGDGHGHGGDGDHGGPGHDGDGGHGHGEPGDQPGEGESGDDNGGDERASARDHGDDDESGDDEGGEEGDDDNRHCSVDQLVEGAVVQEAELKLTSGGLVFKEIELAK